ncbi:hypothetical protein GGS23DRAFT_595709 [Durotheca rogersii]|uniref:uncharacterized protein n=1 Tax=Durotheca rogersii TaxID=419775 RepID=UPI0022206D9E|nr:uncharacterized protein GGS23DRAFT_595709 [Durotheca rogersii]KAI5864058.1 hypothetical protein GGS23DRAFT_595709 [Durotheca rogersii]
MRFLRSIRPRTVQATIACLLTLALVASAEPIPARYINATLEKRQYHSHCCREGCIDCLFRRCEEQNCLPIWSSCCSEGRRREAALANPGLTPAMYDEDGRMVALVD